MEKRIWSIRGGIGCVGGERQRRGELKRGELYAIKRRIWVIMR